MGMSAPVAVISGGNGGYAAAADLSRRGFDVHHYVRTTSHHEELLEEQAIKLRVAEVYQGDRRTPGDLEEVPIERVTTDLGEAVRATKRLVVLVPTLFQPDLFDRLAPLLQDDQAVLLAPGNFGSRLLRRKLAARSDPPDLILGETPTLPYVARKSGDREVTINLDAVRLPVGAFPGRDTGMLLERIEPLYDSVLEAEDALDAALNNSNVGVNATPTLLNAGAIDCEEIGPFNIHRHGVTDRVLRVILETDAERVALRRELGYGSPDFTQDEYYRPEENSAGHFYGRTAKEATFNASTFSEDPPSLDDRYVHEDVGIAAVLMASLGEYLDVETPTLDALVQLANGLMDRDYRQSGRSLERLGLERQSREAFKEGLKHGFS